MAISKKKAGFEFDQLIKKLIITTSQEEVSPEQFLKMPLSVLKDCSKEIAVKIDQLFGIKTIHDLAKVTQDLSSDKLNEMVVKLGLSELMFETWVVLARMALNIKDMKRSDAITSKIIFAGLGQAGKTSLIQSFIYKSNTEDALNTRPTLGVDAHKLNFPDGNLLIWELGGQTRFHDTYFTNPERYFLSIHALVYIIDIQDSARFKESCLYFIQILEILSRLGINCHIILLFHKCDPDFMKQFEFLANTEQLQKLFIPELTKRRFTYLSRFTSVYYSSKEMESLLDNILDIKQLSEILMKAQESDHLSEKMSVKSKIKSFFNRLGKGHDEDLNNLTPFSMPEEKIIKQIELENVFHLVNSDAFKSLIKKKDFDNAAPTIGHLIESWTTFRAMKK